MFCAQHSCYFTRPWRMSCVAWPTGSCQRPAPRCWKGLRSSAAPIPSSIWATWRPIEGRLSTRSSRSRSMKPRKIQLQQLRRSRGVTGFHRARPGSSSTLHAESRNRNEASASNRSSSRRKPRHRAWSSQGVLDLAQELRRLDRQPGRLCPRRTLTSLVSPRAPDDHARLMRLTSLPPPPGALPTRATPFLLRTPSGPVHCLRNSSPAD